jgi:hypothetical protein
MSNLDFPSNYKSEIIITQENNLNKYKLTLLFQERNTITVEFNSALINLYRGVSLSFTDKLSNTFLGFVRSVDYNTQTAIAIICHNNINIPEITKVEYYEWWLNKRPAATILNYIFINEESNG